MRLIILFRLGMIIGFAGHAKILLGQCPITVSAGEDILLCTPPTPTQLNGDIDGPYLNFSWIPTTGLTGFNTLTPTVSVTQNTTYVLRARAVNSSINLISNGDFEGGSSGFTTDYISSPGNLVPEGTYEVLDNPQSSHPGFAACGDHTSGSGQMMAINGNGTANQDVWCQTVAIQPNTEYAFTAWACSVVGTAPAILQFSVNGTNIGTTFGVSSQLCNWQQFYTIWNSGGNSSATICVVNQNTALSGNDFAIDDIGLSPICVVTDTVRVRVASVTAVASPTVYVIPCEDANVTLNGTGSSVGAGYTYEWGGSGTIVSGGNTLTPVVSSAGSYTLTVTYTSGTTECTKTATANVINTSAPLSAWISPASPLGCGGNSVTLIGNSTQGTVTYAWSTTNGNIVSGQNNKNCVVNQPGTYTLLVTNTATGCTATAETTVTTATNPPLAVANSANTITCLQSNAVLSGSGSSTGSNITYVWQALPGGGQISGSTTAINATASAPGIFVLSVTNTTNGCITRDTVTVIGNTILPNLTISPPDSLTCIEDTVSISATLLAPSNTSLVWSTTNGNIAGSTTGASILATTSGLYNVVATNPSNGCTSTRSVQVITDRQIPIAVVLPADSLTCQQTSVSLSGLGSSTGAAYAYLWQGTNVVSGGQTLAPVVNAPGIYTLRVTNQNNGCTATANTLVVADANTITAVASAPDTLDCVTNAFVLSSSGSTNGSGFQYAWTTSSGQITMGETTPSPTITAPGTYTLLLTNPANGCSSTAFATVTQNLAVPDFQVPNPAAITCSAPNVTLLAQNNTNNGLFSFFWGTSGGQFVSGQNTATPVVNQPGGYTVTVTNLQNGCTSTLSTTVISADQIPILTMTPPATLTCLVQNIPLQVNVSGVTGLVQTSWSTIGGNITNGPNSTTPTVNAPGAYNVVVTNPANGCSATATVTVQQDTVSPVFSLATPGILTCTDTTRTLQATLQTSGANLVWSGTNGNFISGTSGLQVMVDQAGLYQVIASNPSNGCSSTNSVNVQADQIRPVVVIPNPQMLTCTQTTVPLSASVTQAGSNFNVVWSSLTGSFSLPTSVPQTAVNAPGLYNILVTNTVNGCTTTASTTVQQNIQVPVTQVSATGRLTCVQTSLPVQGSISGFSSNITPVWSTTNGNFFSGQNALTPLVDQPGTYQLAATDPANGCSSTASVTIQQDTLHPIANAGADATLLCSSNSLIINGSVSSESNLQITWTASQPGSFVGPSNITTPQITLPGTYIMEVVNPANGCRATDAVVIAADVNAPVVAIATPATLTCIVQQVVLAGSATGTNPTITPQWTTSNGTIANGAGTFNPTASAPGIYILTATDATNGCTASKSIVVLQNTTPPVAEAGTAQVLTCDLTVQNLTGSTNLTSGATFNWATSNGNIFGGQTTLTPQIDAPGTYTLTVTNTQNGCVSTDVVTVVENVVAPVLTTAVPGILTCTQTSLTLSASSQPSTVTAAWTTSNGQLVSGINTLMPLINKVGTYLLSVKSTVNGCTATAPIVVTENKTPPLVDAGSNGLLTCATNSLAVTGTASGTNGSATVIWSTQNGNIISGGSTLQAQVNRPGTYTLTATDPANGCTATDALSVGIDTIAPVIGIALPELLTCVRKEATLSATVGNATNFALTWTSIGGSFVSGQQTLSPSVNAPATYQLAIVNNTNGCTATRSVEVQENTILPVVDAGPGGILHCNQETLSLTSTISNAGTAPVFAWSTSDGSILNGANSASATVDAAGTYQLTVTNPLNGCSAVDQTSTEAVEVPDFEPTLVQPNCLLPTGSIAFGVIGGGEAPFVYSFDGGNNFSAENERATVRPGTYTLIVKDAFGCTSEAEVALFEPVYPSVSLPTLQRIEQGDSIQLIPNTTPPAAMIQTWSWTEQALRPVADPSSLGCTDCPSPWASPVQNTLYTLTITDPFGCTATARTTVEVDRRRYIYAPNVFTPDGAAPNHRFTIFGRGVVEIEILQVFDRWGELVWQGNHLAPNDVDAGWDGRMGNRALVPGVFVWQAILVFPDGETEVFSGDVTIVR